VLGEVKPQSDFIQWNIALHRSLFLKETGRIIVGVVSFLLFLITISGVILIAKRQQGLRNFFANINKDFFSVFFHVIRGIFLITISGVILIAKRQQGLRNFFAKINKDFFSQYFHVVSGRIFLIPVLILALTGTHLFMVRIGLVNGKSQTVDHVLNEDENAEQ